MLKDSNVYISDIGWTTLIDLKNKLILYVAINIEKFDIDATKVDPDGIPLTYVEGKHVTRVRKMTDVEFDKYVTEFGMKLEIDMAVVKKPKFDKVVEEKK